MTTRTMPDPLLLTGWCQRDDDQPWLHGLGVRIVGRSRFVDPIIDGLDVSAAAGVFGPGELDHTEVAGDQLEVTVFGPHAVAELVRCAVATAGVGVRQARAAAEVTGVATEVLEAMVLGCAPHCDPAPHL